MSGQASETALLEFLGEIYRAAGDLAHWPQVLAGFPGVIDCAGVTLYVVDRRDGSVPLIVNHGLPEIMEREYREYYLGIDPRPPCALAHWNQPVYDYLHSTEAEIDGSEYYDWHRRRAGFRYYIGAALADADGLATYIGLQRTPRQGHVDDHEIAVFDRLLPHLRRAVALSTSIAELRTRATAFEDTLYAAETAMVLLDCRGCVVFATAAAEEVLSAADGLHLDRERRLRASRSSDDSRLRGLIATVGHDDVGATRSAGGEAAIPRPSGLPPFVVSVRRLHLPEDISPVHRSVVTAVTIRDPAAATRPETWRLRSVFGLTPAEAALASAVAGGCDLKTYAEEAGVSRETVRWHLKNIFAKTDTNRQADLVRLLLKAAPPRPA